MKRLFTTICLAAFVCLPALASAAIYRWVDDQGNVHYTDHPPPSQQGTAKKVEVQSAPTAKPAPRARSSRTQRPATPMAELVDRYRNKNRALWESASKGYLNDVKRLLRAGADIETLDSGQGYTSTPLLIALRNRHLEVAEHLLANGADFNVTNGAGDNALHVGSHRGFDRFVLDLLVRGADVNSRNVDGETPLRLAAERGHLDVVKNLLRSKADPEIPDVYGKTPLMFAVMTQKQELLELLLAAGADPNTRTDVGESALLWAVQKGNAESVNRLIAGNADVNARNNEGLSPLLRAARFGNVEIVNALLAAGAKANARDKNNETAATLAARRGHIQVLTRLESPQ